MSRCGRTEPVPQTRPTHGTHPATNRRSEQAIEATTRRRQPRQVRFLRTQQCVQPTRTPETVVPTPALRRGQAVLTTRATRTDPSSQCSTNELPSRRRSLLTTT